MLWSGWQPCPAGYACDRRAGSDKVCPDAGHSLNFPRLSEVGKDNHCSGTARIAQLAEQLICNQQVGGSNPPAGSKLPENPVFRARSDS